ncbi:MAG: LamG domain-containing protein, partial [Bacteroidetes bacterium]|nr:LamG domain-containing protein [Bacteroidota bacterium]
MYTDVLHIRGEETNNEFTDSSIYHHNIANNGAIHDANSISSLGDGSIRFDGQDDYLEIADSSNWILGNNDFTIDFWAYVPSLPAAGNSYDFVEQSARNIGNAGLVIRLKDNGELHAHILGQDETIVNLLEGGSITLNAWHHIAYVRRGDNFDLYLDGVSVAGGTGSGEHGDFPSPLNIGRHSCCTESVTNGYLDEIRIRNGRAMTDQEIRDYYEENKQTIVLHIRGEETDSQFTDSSPEAHSITTNGSLHDTNCTGSLGDGSVRFDGQDDYLEIADSPDWSLGSDDFTIDFWAYVPSLPAAG